MSLRHVVVDSAAQSLEGLRDGATLLVGGFGGAGLPRAIIQAVLALSLIHI